MNEMKVQETDETVGVPTEVLVPETTPIEAPVPKSLEVRKEALARMIQSQIAGGARIESQSDTQAVLVKGHRTNHMLHFFIGLFTLGLWWIVWAGIALFGGEKREVASVDEWGNSSLQRL
jgi:hypothetical protein